MIAIDPVDEIDHPVLQPAARGSAVRAAGLSDQQRLAVLAQGAALLAHLEHGRWSLPAGWKGGRVDETGALSGVSAAPGISERSAQQQLLELVAELFGSGRVAGRGQARRVVRRLLRWWRDPLLPIPADLAVAQLLESDVLWEMESLAWRRALLGWHVRGPQRRPWIAGPGGSRRRLLRAASEGRFEELLESNRLRELWASEEAADAFELAGRGRHAAAVSAWRLTPPTDGPGRQALADSLFALGRFESARRAVRGLPDRRARQLDAWCLHYLGHRSGAQRAIQRLFGRELSVAEQLDLADLAIRLHAAAGRPRETALWAERALAAAVSEEERLTALLLAAEAAWDRGEGAEIEERLRAAAAAADHPLLAWRYHQAVALGAVARQDAAGAVSALGTALLQHRRQLTSVQAASLWNDLAVARAAAGDLGRAERAASHAVQLQRRCEGPRRTTVALRNLAEVRLRRGRFAGVAEILERSLSRSRLDGNFRAIVQDLALWARWEQSRGLLDAALETCQSGLELLDQANSDWHRAELNVLASRLHGWRGNPERAAHHLECAGGSARGVLEPEEVPALFALSGDREGALLQCSGSPLASCWSAALSDAAPPDSWAPFEELEPYRAARLVLDWELVQPGWIPEARRRAAATTLRRLGAVPLGELLECRGPGDGWSALQSYLRVGRGDFAAAAALVASASGGAAELAMELAGAKEATTEGGLRSPLGNGVLCLRTGVDDPMMQAIFELLAADLAELRVAPDVLSGELGNGPIIGRSSAIQLALERLPRLARGDFPVLVHGETGTGKELVARRVHELSRRPSGPFVPINCAALSESLVLSDLFGHVRGSFTGADRDRAGVFEAARGGTVFLDEIGDLPLSAQGLLLRVLQEGELRRVGESLPRRVDVRVVAATHRDLAGMVKDGTFRQDLFFRLKVAPISLPPLREREGDLELLAHSFLAAKPWAGGKRLSTGALRRLRRHSWPGNVRELENVLEAAAALAEGSSIEAEDLPLDDLRDAPQQGGIDYHSQVESLRRRLLREALAASGGNQAEAARRLGITRQSLSYLVRRLLDDG